MSSATIAGGPVDRLVRAGVFAVFPHRRRLRAALLFRRLPAPGRSAPLKQIAPPWAAPEWPPEHLPGEGPRVALLAGCVASVVFGDVNAATARVLNADGFDVHVPRSQACCGALHAHAGRLEEGIARARRLERDLAGHELHRHERGGLRLAPEGSRRRECRRRVGAARRAARGAKAAAAAGRVPGLVPPPACTGHLLRATRDARGDPGARAARAGRAGDLLRQRRHLQHRRGARRRRSSAIARPARCWRPSRTRTRAGTPAASSRSRRRCAGRAARPLPSIRSSSSTPRSAACAVERLIEHARR